MKHLKCFKAYGIFKTLSESLESEKINNYKKDIEEISDIYQEFFDDFDFEIHKSAPYDTDIIYFTNGIQFEIRRGYQFDAECIMIRINFSSFKNVKINRTLDYTCFNNFDLISNPKMVTLLEECHNRTIQVFKPVDTLVGSIGTDLDIIYFTEKPKLERYKGVNIYGSNYQLDIPEVGSLVVNSRHSNIINIIDGEKINMCVLMGYFDCDYYYLPNVVFPNLFYLYSGLPIERWVEYEWKNMCFKLKVRRNIKGIGTKVNRSNMQIMPSEFMIWLKDHVSNFSKFK